MSINCDVILQRGAASEQLTALGTALWRWCNRAGTDAGIYQRLDNQALADLIAGRMPTSSQTPQQAERRQLQFRVRDEQSQGRQAAIDGLRREISARGVEDILVDGKSWNLSD